LHYGTLLGTRACVRMAAAAWASAFLNALLHTANTFSIPLCQGNVLDQFFCEIPQILKLSCSQSYLREVGLLVFTAFLMFGCFVFIVLSYVQIFTAVLRMPSEQGRHKAFSMCLPHLVVVSLFVSTSFFAYLKPPSISSPALDLVVAVVYSVVPPVRDLAFVSFVNSIKVLATHSSFLQGSIWMAALNHLVRDNVKPLAKTVVNDIHYSPLLHKDRPFITEAVNPLLYSMRNKELKDALRKLILVVVFKQQ
ncbi:olfactory receptor 14J1-like, partial [Struthio camelus]|uniref:olfactory receptor 14J1-like n=1 Tax=Struthio camelus TaxID=8801 RepID=UPI003603E3D0